MVLEKLRWRALKHHSRRFRHHSGSTRGTLVKVSQSLHKHAQRVFQALARRHPIKSCRWLQITETLVIWCGFTGKFFNLLSNRLQCSNTCWQQHLIILRRFMRSERTSMKGLPDIIPKAPFGPWLHTDDIGETCSGRGSLP